MLPCTGTRGAAGPALVPPSWASGGQGGHLGVRPDLHWAPPGPWGLHAAPRSPASHEAITHLLPPQKAAVGAVALNRFPDCGIPPAGFPEARARRSLVRPPSRLQGFSKARTLCLPKEGPLLSDESHGSCGFVLWLRVVFIASLLQAFASCFTKLLTKFTEQESNGIRELD